MLGKACLVSFGVMVALGAVVWWTNPRGADASDVEVSDASVLAIQPWDVSQVTLSKNGEQSRVVRGASGYRLLLADRRLPVDESRVRAAVRLLRDGLRSTDGENDSFEVAAVLGLVEGDDENAKAWTVELGRVGAGGSAGVGLTGPDGVRRFAEVEGEIARSILDDGLIAWTDPRVLAGLDAWMAQQAAGGSGPSSVRQEVRVPGADAPQVFEARRTGSRWRMLEPRVDVADSDVVGRLLAGAAQMSAIPGESGGAFEPLLELVISGDGTDPGEDRRSFDERYVLEVGAASVRGQLLVRSRHERVTRDSASGEVSIEVLWGPRDGVIDAASLGLVGMAPSFFVDRVAAEIRAGEVGVARLNGTALTRAGDVWERESGESADDTTAVGLEQLLQLLCGERAAEVREAGIEGYTASLRIELARRVSGVGEIRAGVYEVGIVSDGSRTMVIVDDGVVIRAYPVGERSPMVALLGAFGAIPGSVGPSAPSVDGG